MTKQTMPDGWIRVTWKDRTGKKFASNIPISTFGHFELNLLSKGGIIVKEEF